MSNVLIGIIGVILFIGLALAGALFLGPRFQESTNSSKATEMVQAVTQVTSAIGLYQLNEGRILDIGSGNAVETLVTKGYLKPGLDSNDRNYVVIGTDNGTTVSMRLGPRRTNAPKEVCEIINKQTSNPSIMPSGPTGQSGCYYYTDSQAYFVYSRL